MTGNCLLVYTNQSLVEMSHLNKVYYFFPWGSLEFPRIESRQKHISCKYKLPEQEAYRQTEKQHGIMNRDETLVRNSHSLPVFCFNYEARNDKMRVRRFVPHSKHIASPLRRPSG